MGSSWLLLAGAQTSLALPGPADFWAAFTGISESSPEAVFAFLLVPAAQGASLGRQGGSLPGVQAQPPNLLRQPRKHLVT